MDDLIQKKIILCLLDCVSKSSIEIANEIGESLADIEDQLTLLVSKNLCEKRNQDGIDQYVVKKDIETFAQLVKEFLSDKQKHEEQIAHFITSDYYLSRIDFEFVDYVIRRFYLKTVYQTDEDKEGIRRILLVSPSALIFTLYGDTTIFREMMSNSDQLDSSDETNEWMSQILHSQFMTPLLEMLIADMKASTYGILYAKLQLRVATLRTQVNLATLNGKYVEAMTGGNFSLYRAAEDLRAGQLVSYIDPMNFCYDGVAFLHLGEFQIALDNFNKALTGVQDPNQKAAVLNNKGWAFLNLKQYQKAIECFDKGIELDTEHEISLLHKNKQVAKEFLALATDTDNLTEPTQIRFVVGQPVPFEETRFYEFKEITGGNASRSIAYTSDIYAVAFLNREGGRIFWGVRDNDRITVGVKLDEEQRDEVRRIVSEKLGAIRPPISVEGWQLEFHQVYDLQSEIVEDLWVVELLVSPPQRKDIYYTGSGELHVKTEGGKKKLLGIEVTEFIRRHFQNETETE